MTWAGKRKLIYTSIVLGIFLLISGVVWYKATDTPPTCFDNRKNGNETGIDCGGGCALYCANTLSDPKVRWVNSFFVVPGVYHAVSYFEHNNTSAASERVSYVFKLYDEKGTLIAEKQGTTFIGPFGKSAIVESLIKTGNVVPAITRFEFTSPILWTKISPEFAQVVINTNKYVFDQSLKDSTRLAVTLENTSRFSFKDLEVVAILSDKDGNAITAVKNIVPSLNSLESKIIYFTWSYKINPENVKVEIIPRINPFTSTRI